MDWWDELAVAALLGTDRRPIVDFSFLPGKLASTAGRLGGDPDEARTGIDMPPAGEEPFVQRVIER